MADTTSTTVKKGVAYTFGGEYYCREDKGLTAKTYEISVTFPEPLQAPLASFKKGVSTAGHPIRNLMVKNYPDFTAIRTFSVLNVVNYTTSKPVKTNDIKVMGIEQLKSYILENGYDINVAVYNNQVDKIREAITLLETDPEKFKTVYAETIREYEYNKQLIELNAGNEEINSNNTTKENSGEGVDDLLADLDGKTPEGENDTHE